MTSLSRLFKDAKPQEAAMLPGNRFFVRRLSVEGDDVPGQVNLALEAISPFPLEQMLVGFVTSADGKKVLGYGASTKGNVTLQFCGVTTHEIAAIAEVNPDKFGRETPGTHIPIVSEAEAKAMKPDYFLVLPWHFKEGILQREQEYIAGGGKFIFPFPEIEII